jgi:hypothetical protein
LDTCAPLREKKQQLKRLPTVYNKAKEEQMTRNKFFLETKSEIKTDFRQQQETHTVPVSK